MDAVGNPRLPEVVGALVRHLHACANKNEAARAEWRIAIAFLTETGRMRSDARQEFILASDVPGRSMLADAIKDPGHFATNEGGEYHFVGIRPVIRPIPGVGPVGRMLAALGRHPSRPAHSHFRVTAEGYRAVATHTFVAGDPWQGGGERVFGVKRSLIVEFLPNA